VAYSASNRKEAGFTFLRNVCSHTDYTSPYPRRWQH
jgi:hypothetical protein